MVPMILLYQVTLYVQNMVQVAKILNTDVLFVNKFQINDISYVDFSSSHGFKFLEDILSMDWLYYNLYLSKLD